MGVAEQGFLHCFTDRLQTDFTRSLIPSVAQVKVPEPGVFSSSCFLLTLLFCLFNILLGSNKLSYFMPLYYSQTSIKQPSKFQSNCRKE